jgi:Family of unknown function (DUF6447)
MGAIVKFDLNWCKKASLLENSSKNYDDFRLGLVQSSTWSISSITRLGLMSIIRIDEVDYELDLLTEEARAQLVSVQHTDQKIAELQRDLAIAQTARASYASALRDLLGHGADAASQPAAGLQVRH